jgi:NSS family neurotransmitter:Na+ symporter
MFALGLKPNGGSSTLFVTMSNLFSKMPLGNVFGSLFFLLVLFIWKFKKYQDETNVGAIKLKVFNWWGPLVRLIIPVGITAIFIAGLS